LNCPGAKSPGGELTKGRNIQFYRPDKWCWCNHCNSS